MTNDNEPKRKSAFVVRDLADAWPHHAPGAGATQRNDVGVDAPLQRDIQALRLVHEQSTSFPRNRRSRFSLFETLRLNPDRHNINLGGGDIFRYFADNVSIGDTLDVSVSSGDASDVYAETGSDRSESACIEPPQGRFPRDSRA